LRDRDRKVFRFIKKRTLMDAPLLAFSFIVGCTHYPINQPIKGVRLDAGYRSASMKMRKILCGVRIHLKHSFIFEVLFS